MNQYFSTIALTVAALLAASIAAATPITGVANIAGNVNVSARSIAFSPTFTTAGSQQTGSFTGTTGGSIQSLSGGAFTGSTYIPGFITFIGAPNPVVFDLTYISPGVGTQAGCRTVALGAQCTPAGSPFTLFQLTSNTVIATLQLNGVAYVGNSATGSTPVNSLFSTQSVLFGTLPMIYDMLQSGGTIQGVTYSAAFASQAPVNTTPEPASVVLTGLALTGIGFLLRRK